MKRLILLAFATLIVLSLIVTSVVKAADSRQSENITLANDQSYDGLYIRAGKTIKINGKVSGDVFLVAQDIMIDGEVSGNVYAAAQNITIKGRVGGSTHLAGARIEVSGGVDGSVLAVGSLVNLTKDSKIGRGVLVAGSTVEIAGPVASDVYVGSSSLVLSNSIGGSVTTAVEQLTLARGASVGGNLTYTSAQDATIENDTMINGSIKRIDPAVAKKPSLAQRAQTTVYGIIAQMLIGLLIVSYLPKTAIASADYISSNPLKSFFGGIGIFFISLLVILVALMAVFGLPLAVMMAMGLIFLAMVASLFLVPFWLGRLIIRTRDNSFSSLALSLFGGVVVVAVIILLPLIGPLFGFMMFFTSLGALSLRSWERFNLLSKAQRQQ